MSQVVHEPERPDVSARTLATGTPPFGETDVKYLHQADMTAAAMVFGLMAGIFIFGLVLYTAIAFTAMSD